MVAFALWRPEALAIVLAMSFTCPTAHAESPETEAQPHMPLIFTMHGQSFLIPLTIHGRICDSYQTVNIQIDLTSSSASPVHIRGPGGRFKNAYKLLTLRALKISMFHKRFIFQCMGKIFCVEFQRYPLKFHTKYLSHTLKDIDFIHRWRFKSS